MKKNKKYHGFTLMELLVVIAIIALLLSILMPALNKAKDAARVVVCLSNLHQIGIASASYLAENNDQYYQYLQYESATNSPATREYGQGGIPCNENNRGIAYFRSIGADDLADRAETSEDWRPINQYIKSYDLWKCPADKGRAEIIDPLASTWWGIPPDPWPIPMWANPLQGSSYQYNCQGIPMYWNTNIPNPNRNVDNKNRKIKQPSRFVVFHEYTFLETCWGRSNGSWLVQSGPEPRPMEIQGWGLGLGGAGRFHDRLYTQTPTAPVAYADGHSTRLRNIRGAGGGGTGFEYDYIPYYGTVRK